MTTVRVQIDENSFRQADRLLARLPIELRGKIIPRALKSAVTPATRLMRQLAPDSVASGSRLRWSRKMRERRASTKQHKQTIGASTVRKYGQTIAVYAGPLHPAGNLINVIGHPHRQMLWGRDSGVMLPANTYVLQAGRQTISQQTSVFVNAVSRGVDREAAKR